MRTGTRNHLVTGSGPWWRPSQGRALQETMSSGACTACERARAIRLSGPRPLVGRALD